MLHFVYRMNRLVSRTEICLSSIALLVVTAISCNSFSILQAQDAVREGRGYTDTPTIPGQKWRVHDKYRPRPPIVKAGSEYGQPPQDAIVLFNGEDLTKWKRAGADADADWIVKDGYFEAAGGKGSIETRDEFGDIQLHIEWASPQEPKGSEQGRGNSGVILMGRYEIQVLDSFNNDTYADGQASAIYGQHPPQVNVSRGPGEWQSYDIIFEAPRFKNGQLEKPAKATILHNGVLVHHARELTGPMAHKEVHPYKPHGPKGRLLLQDHNNPVRFRNVWVRELREESEPWIEMKGIAEKRPAGVEKPKKVVLIAGDEEYRSEEALPMLAKILSEQHGFDCAVLFPINPTTGTVDPNYGKNIPGLHHLDDADAMILFTRFRDLPAWQMKHIDDFCKRGGSVIGLRTATHAFNMSGKDNPYAKWSHNSKEWPGGFGQQVLGETWVSHHGNHKSESARGIIAEDAKNSPILKGVENLWAPSDVYGITHLVDTAKILVRGQILKGMKPDDAPVEDKRNNPMMPIVWTKDYQLEGGKVGKALCSTMCSSVDLENEGLRRLLVNATYWATELEEKIPEKASVVLPENYKPTFFGFHSEKDYFPSRRIKPIDLVP